MDIRFEFFHASVLVLFVIIILSFLLFLALLLISLVHIRICDNFQASFNLALDCLQIHGSLHNFRVIFDFIKFDWFSEGPRVVMLHELVNHILRLIFKRTFLSLSLQIVLLFSPACLFDSTNFFKGETGFVLRKLKASLPRKGVVSEDFGVKCRPLLPQIFVESGVSNVPHN